MTTHQLKSQKRRPLPTSPNPRQSLDSTPGSSIQSTEAPRKPKGLHEPIMSSLQKPAVGRPSG